MPRPLPFPIVIEMVVFGAASIRVALFLVKRGTLPRWLPSGYVDQAGKRAELWHPSMQLWSMLAIFSALAINWMVFYSRRP